MESTSPTRTMGMVPNRDRNTTTSEENQPHTKPTPMPLPLATVGSTCDI